MTGVCGIPSWFPGFDAFSLFFFPSSNFRSNEHDLKDLPQFINGCLRSSTEDSNVVTNGNIF